MGPPYVAKLPIQVIQRALIIEANLRLVLNILQCSIIDVHLISHYVANDAIVWDVGGCAGETSTNNLASAAPITALYHRLCVCDSCDSSAMAA